LAAAYTHEYNIQSLNSFLLAGTILFQNLILRKMINIIISDFMRFNAEDTQAFSNTVDARFVANPTQFPSPLPTNAEYRDGIDVLTGAIAAAAGNDKFALALLDEAVIVVKNNSLLRAGYLNTIAQGNKNIVIEGGYTPIKQRSNRYITQMDTPTVKIGASRGTVDAATPGQKAMKNCTWYITKDPSKPLVEWTPYNNEGARFTYTGLITGETYYICVQMCGPRKQCLVSPIASIVAY
jgi:hypothetical protein